MTLNRLFISLSLALMPCAEILAAPQCPTSTQAPAIHFDFISTEPQYDHSQNAQQIRRLSKKQLGENWSQAGLTLTKLQYQQSIKVTYYELGRGQYCMRLSQANFKLGYSDIKVYISNQYARNSCEFATILDHENRHVLIHTQTLKQYLPVIEYEMTQFVQKLKPDYFTAAEQSLVTERLKVKLEKKMTALVQVANQEIQRSNAAMDTKANYLKEQVQCSNW